MFAQGFRLMGATSREIVNFVVEAAAHMGSGEFNQKDFEHKGKVTESDYMDIIDGKTAKLIECAAKCGAALAAVDIGEIDAIGHFANRTGMAFQIIDDTLDVIGDKGKTGKDTGNDIYEGKPTLPTIYAMDDPVDGSRIREIFEKERPTREEVTEAISLIRDTDSVSRCLIKAKEIVDDALHYLDCIPDSDYKASIIGLAEYIVSRDR